MKEAAGEEKKNAIERESFYEGVPAIAVIVDGGGATHTQTFCKVWHCHNHRCTHW